MSLKPHPIQSVPEATARVAQEGYSLVETDLAHIWPMRYADLNIYGKYRFNVEETHGRQGLRPLRQPGRRG